jgi:two-component system, NtrC family, nitrogen regulation sensor histidine kinase NtrY
MVSSSRRRFRRVPLGNSGKRFSFERRLRLWFWLLGLPALFFAYLHFRQQHFSVNAQILLLSGIAIAWMIAISFVMEEIVRPLQTLSNVISALREDDYSFRARGAVRTDALGDLALEINALANTLQSQRGRALEATALLERVIKEMQSPVLAFDPEGHLQLLNASGARALELDLERAIGQTAEKLHLNHLLGVADQEMLSLTTGRFPTRWIVRRTAFRLRGIPHTLLVLSDVSMALRLEQRQAWQRLIRVLGHEINNSLAPIKSIAGSLRMRINSVAGEGSAKDFERGLSVIEDRAESLNRFLQAYHQLSRLPLPTLRDVEIRSLIEKVSHMETRLTVAVKGGPEITLQADSDQIEQVLINLVRNAAEAAASSDFSRNQKHEAPAVEIAWCTDGADLRILIRDNGPGLTNESNLFVPFYTTKPGGSGIGLTLARQIAEGHKGTVMLRNRVGMTGCEAELRLPLDFPQIVPGLDSNAF